MSRAARSALALAFIFTLVPAVSAKTRTVRLTITGGHLGQPLEVSNPRALVSVWTGTRAPESWFDVPDPFFESVTPEPPPSLTRYTVAFYADVSLEEPKVRQIYAVRYVPDPQSGGGFVYLPGPSERFYGIVIRRGKDGKWLRASSEWSSALNAALAAAGPR